MFLLQTRSYRFGSAEENLLISVDSVSDHDLLYGHSTRRPNVEAVSSNLLCTDIIDLHDTRLFISNFRSSTPDRAVPSTSKGDQPLTNEE
jgi:hypothetical protein